MVILTSKQLGRLRRALFVPWDSKWNAWVCDITAKLG